MEERKKDVKPQAFSQGKILRRRLEEPSEKKKERMHAGLSTDLSGPRWGVGRLLQGQKQKTQKLRKYLE